MSEARVLVNESRHRTEAPPGRPLLDFVRRELGLTGTKEGCREGDCGACAVIIGEFVEGAPRYRAHPSCLAFVGELGGRHLVTIEGLAAAAEKAGLEGGLTPVMRALLEKNGSQCGFCSPGFVTSLTAWLLEGDNLTEEGAIRAVDGNLCRCTGYASIRRAARVLLEEFRDLPSDPMERIARLVGAGAVPAACLDFARGGLGEEGDRAGSGAAAGAEGAGAAGAAGLPVGGVAGAGAKGLLVGGTAGAGATGMPVGGGSDLAIRAPESVIETAPRFLRTEERFRRITRHGNEVEIGAAVSVRDFFSSPLVRGAVPGIEAFETRFASTLVRNRATIGGNLANASPVADLTPVLLALGARLGLEGPGGSREVALEGFFEGYRRLGLRAGEIIATVILPVLGADERFNFEKLSKRENLDIATVNSAARIRLSGDGRTVVSARISAGGVAAVPLLLDAAARCLEGKPPTAALALEAGRIAAAGVTPIDDVRGSAVYRREALGRLVAAHVLALAPELAGELAAGFAAAGRDGAGRAGGPAAQGAGAKGGRT